MSQLAGQGKDEKSIQPMLFEVPKVYSCLVLDPPWRYELRVTDDTHRGKIPYKSMAFDEIRDLPIAQLADPNGCVQFLWTTNNHMADAFKLLECWGFTTKTILTWEKVSKNGKTRIGNGHWFRSSTEHCIIATKGKVSCFSSHSAIARKTSNLIKAERREHSRKPDEFYRLVEEVCKGAKLEMFARQQREGWDCWGDQVDMFDAEAV
jgi:N6-adenosine-specific RNA methylase IME4